MRSQPQDLSPSPTPLRHLTLLGPQRRQPTLGAVLDELGVEGEVAVVTAGWQERESEDAELRAEIEGSSGRRAPRSMTQLGLYGRTERVFATHPELLAALQKRHDRRQALEERYRRRLDLTLAAARHAFAWRGDPRLLPPEMVSAERQHAVQAVVSLDRHHARRLALVNAGWPPDTDPVPALARGMEEVHRRIADSAALVLAGGHVAVLRHRLELFGFKDLLADYHRPVIAWSAAAMLLAEIVVLFHDRPPQGPGSPELFGDGLGFAPRIVVLPDGSQRLRLDDTDRVALFARRFKPRLPLVFDNGARLDLVQGEWTRTEGLRRLLPDGSVESADTGDSGESSDAS